ncbi:hypothetical protein QBC37DRAFT_427801 [Rhypophila decipiens]|uniref:Uncharacterized protein n=1 Tax=Rhypophila decipiens TaxID=261697 RepID=A0AAN6Y7U6_9PEZI|nr:hypothetical protein QBC37DRAFT_427801 [Rhypophila decipiens]
MCTYHYLHHHHVSPCTRDIDMVVHYSFCPDATIDSSTGSQMPCDNVQYDYTQTVDYTDPCATGGCLTSPDCSSGGCRLEQLNGRWKCCKCGRGGNEYRWCCHRMRNSPDTFCYHVCCSNCKPHPIK